MALVFSKENMTKLANEMKGDSGYTLKKSLLDSIIRLMNKYDIPREQAILYANEFLFAVLGQLPEVAPKQYDRYFQSEWREEQEKTLNDIKQRIENVNREIALYKNRSMILRLEDRLIIHV